MSSVLSMMIRVTRASAGGTHARSTTTARTNQMIRCSMPISSLSPLVVVAERRCRLGRQFAVRRRHAGIQSRLEQPRLLARGVLTEHQAILDQAVDRAIHCARV